MRRLNWCGKPGTSNSKRAALRGALLRATCIGWLPARGLLAFCLLWSAIGLVWWAGLPAVAKYPAIDARLRELDAAGIDASAMFYSELPAMDGVFLRLDRMERRRARGGWEVAGARE
ncbi:MAG: hypothetical protein ACT4QC_17220 [Planctomycetaceae bacterium]